MRVRIRRFGGLSEMWVAGLSMQRVARELAEQHLPIQPYGLVFSLFMEGNFEASVLLLDTSRDVSFAKHVREEFVVAVPARDVLAFGDSSSAEVIAELNAITGRVHANGRGAHLLSPRLYRRSGGMGAEYDRVV